MRPQLTASAASRGLRALLLPSIPVPAATAATRAAASPRGLYSPAPPFPPRLAALHRFFSATIPSSTPDTAAAASAAPAPAADLPAQLKDALKQSMKAGTKPRTAVIKSLLSDLTYATKAAAAGAPAAPEDVLLRAVKKRHDAADAYTASGYPNLAATELAEVDIIQEFLPKQLTPDELDAVVRHAAARANATSIKNLGAVIKLALADLPPGSASGKAVSDAARRVLSSEPPAAAGKP
ncbi:hypothetical protein HK405_009149 [Cladochytrium tenue]|nr:hypothetical protein HK405_009149 [Cladochytrium tenue]